MTEKYVKDDEGNRVFPVTGCPPYTIIFFTVYSGERETHIASVPKFLLCWRKREREIMGENGVTLEELKKRMAEFASERDWDQFHSPRNLLLALVGEVGELSEIFQWRGEVARGLPGWKAEDRQHLGEELSDVLLYLVRLSDVCGVDLGEAALRKLQLNANKYPVHLSKGTSRKHTQINAHAPAVVDSNGD
ncbi:dCTP pyrophosphatase 1-like [Rhodamnia argentea]|uniref:dCTP pyrophosphatase 1-like n=1 Tax=Rhodamnia argentea TaxID=178133 RepID=A0A8B8PPG3_9MYRT|nr:dCTP pyrophosphatase 1-like [Rhodamnia argentea]